MAMRPFIPVILIACLLGSPAAAQSKPEPRASAAQTPAAQAPASGRSEALARVMTSLQRATALTDTGQDLEAEPHYRNAVSILTDLMGADHPVTLEVAGPLASNLLMQGRIDESVALMERIYAGLSAFYGDASSQAHDARRKLAMGYMRTDTPLRADPLMRRVIADEPDDPQWVALNQIAMGQMLNTTGRYADAERWLTDALALSASTGVDPRTMASARAHLADSLNGRGRHAEAEVALRQAIAELGPGPVTAIQIDWYWTLAEIVDRRQAPLEVVAAYRQVAGLAVDRRRTLQERSRSHETQRFAEVFETFVARAWTAAAD